MKIRNRGNRIRFSLNLMLSCIMFSFKVFFIRLYRKKDQRSPQISNNAVIYFSPCFSLVLSRSVGLLALIDLSLSVIVFPGDKSFITCSNLNRN